MPRKNHFLRIMYWPTVTILWYFILYFTGVVCDSNIGTACFPQVWFYYLVSHPILVDWFDGQWLSFGIEVRYDVLCTRNKDKNECHNYHSHQIALCLPLCCVSQWYFKDIDGAWLFIWVLHTWFCFRVTFHFFDEVYNVVGSLVQRFCLWCGVLALTTLLGHF